MNTLSINPEAQGYHQVGLLAARHASYAQAHISFATAQEVLSSQPQTMDVLVQSARIARDDGFTYVRSALVQSDRGDLERAHAVISGSVASTAPFVSGTAFTESQHPQPHGTPKKMRRELVAEHGASVSLLGRIATAKEVINSIDTRGDDETAVHERTVAQQPYGLAHDMLLRGSNGYYRVSNAMAGARQERLNGRLIHMAVWLGRAAAGATWTAIHDASNFKPAVLTIRNRMAHLRSYDAARDSVISHP